MPRCNLTLKQKSQIIELSTILSTEQIAKKFRVHPTTITRTIQKRARILDQAGRVNANFKTVQTNKRIEEHDLLVLDFISKRHDSKEPISIKEICDKAAEFGTSLERPIKSKRGWWRRFKARCRIIRSRLQPLESDQSEDHQLMQQPVIPKDKKETKNSRRKVYTFKVRESLSGHINTSSSSAQ